MTIQVADEAIALETIERVTVQYFGGSMGILPGPEVASDSQGQAGFAQLPDGRWLFSLRQGALLAEGVYRDLRPEETAHARNELLKQIAGQVRAGPRSVERDLWPRIVTFLELDDPSTVKIVIDHHGKSKSPGLSIRDVTIEVIEPANRSRDIRDVLTWLVDDPHKRFCPITERGRTAPTTCMTLTMGHFLWGDAEPE